MDARISRTLMLISALMHERWTVGTLARETGLSSSRFMTLFKSVVGMSPGQYLRTRRMVRARVLLEHTSLSVAQAMMRVGCHDPSHFARDFKRQHGFPPSECRVFGRPRRVRRRYNAGP